MARILTKDLERLAAVRAALHTLQTEEAELKAKITEALPVGKILERGPFKVAHIACQGSPDYKSAYIALAGEEAAKALPRNTYSKLTFTVTGK